MQMTINVAQGTPVQVLTGSYVVTAITATSTIAALSLALYDSVGKITTPAPGITLANIGSAYSRTTALLPDCSGVPRDYTYNGIGYSASTVIPANPTAPLPIIHSAPPSPVQDHVNLVTTDGLYADATGGTAGDVMVLTIEYQANLPKAV